LDLDQALGVLGALEIAQQCLLACPGGVKGAQQSEVHRSWICAGPVTLDQ
jgi:hypothetical protein